MNEINITWDKGGKLYYTLNGVLMGKHYNWDELFKNIKHRVTDERLNKDGMLNVYDDEND